ncbi:hypothetical protein [Fimbriiglobus ruber]|uniref:Uncharacterized protein n=1 Tax=Fimbriiglobus ruber TaxID=1908690 RepID=A0A225DEA3_9BACT|nr:hypothetical protein [Fimbriiglobus ruber]OWK37974.1 hypothetical protein FRUB_07094 [Fimbriiglobus ruber]
MNRTLLTLIVAAAVSAWASAQNTAPGPIAADQLKLLQGNRTLLEHLLDHSLKVSSAGTALERAEECRRTAVTIGDELKSAAEDPSPNADRVAELSEHVATVVRDGLTPTLSEARRQIHPGSPDFERLEKEQKLVKSELAKVQQWIPSEGKVAQSPKVKDARGKLAAAVEELQK